jgi:flagellar biosynthesis/type III secretory pathway protein FliH
MDPKLYTEEDLQIARDEGYDEGYEVGYDAGYDAGRDEE